jgi:hypothetical protein
LCCCWAVCVEQPSWQKLCEECACVTHTAAAAAASTCMR